MKLKSKHLETLWLELDMLAEHLALIEMAADMDEVRYFVRCAQIDLDGAVAWEQQMSTRLRANKNCSDLPTPPKYQ